MSPQQMELCGGSPAQNLDLGRKKEAVEYLPLVGREDKTRPTTFIELYDAWEPTHRAGKSTMDCYRAAKKYFRPIWHQKLADITVDDLQECLDSCGKGKRTQENMKALAGLIYKYAIPRNMAKINMGQYLIVGGEAGSGKDALPEAAVRSIEAHISSVVGADYVLCQCYLDSVHLSFLHWTPSTIIEKNVHLLAVQKQTPERTVSSRYLRRSSLLWTDSQKTSSLVRFSVLLMGAK